MEKIIIIGAGQAGTSTALQLRRQGFEGEIHLIGAEPCLPYQRPPLSKAYLLGEMPLERLLLKPASFYDTQQIHMHMGQTVQTIDPESKTVTLEDAVLQYDQLVLATGAVPRQLPAAIGGDLQGLYGVRTLADIEALKKEYVSGRHLLIVGGGYIGLEAAAVAVKKGLRVTLVEAADRILQRVAAKETSDYFRQLHASQGVELIEGIGLVALEGQSRVEQARLVDGRVLPVNFVVVGIGVDPATTVAQSAGVQLENGIKTDALGRTSVADIWAVGDCASIPFKERRIRLESVPHAIAHAEIVAKNMLGANQPYQAKPWFWSDQYHVKLQIAGLNSGYDHVVPRRVAGADSASFWYYRKEQLLAVDAMNDPKAYMVGKRLIEAGRSPQKRLIEDEGTDLKSLIHSI